MSRAKKGKKSWTIEDLHHALADIANGMPLRVSAKLHGVPRATLQRRKKKDDFSEMKPGPKTVFNAEQEDILYRHILEMSSKFHGLTAVCVRKIAYYLAEKLKIPHNFNKTLKIAGKDWLHGFLKRHPQIVPRKAENTSINRVTSFSQENVELFYKNLVELMTKFPFQPHRIYNMDETGICTVQENVVVLAQKGKKRVGNVASWERGKNITVICTMNAAGFYVPPVFIYPRERISAALGHDAPVGSLIKCSKNGWTNENIFLDWLQHFVNFVKPSSSDPVLLILDNHSSHTTLAAVDFCIENHIHLLSLPPHCSHRMQPLDVTFYGPLKRAYFNSCDNYIKSNNLQHITPFQVCGIFNTAYKTVAIQEKGISGFKCTGIWPLNPQIFANDPSLIPTKETEEVNVPADSNVPIVYSDSVDDVLENYSLAEHVEISVIQTSQLEHGNEEDFEKELSVLSPVPDIQARSSGTKRRQASEIFTAPAKRQELEDKQKRKEEKQKADEQARETRNKKKEERLMKKQQAEELKKAKQLERAEIKRQKAEENRLKKEKKAEEKLRKTTSDKLPKKKPKKAASELV